MQSSVRAKDISPQQATNPETPVQKTQTVSQAKLPEPETENITNQIKETVQETTQKTIETAQNIWNTAVSTVTNPLENILDGRTDATTARPENSTAHPENFMVHPAPENIPDTTKQQEEVTHMSQTDFAEWLGKQSLQDIKLRIGENLSIHTIEKCLARQAKYRLLSAEKYHTHIKKEQNSVDEETSETYNKNIAFISTKYEGGMSGIKTLKPGFFQVNNGNVADKNRVSKACITLQDPLQTLTVENIEKTLLLLQKKAFHGQMKIDDSATDTQTKLYSVLIYGTNKQSIDIAMHILQFVYGDSIVYTDTFIDKAGSNHARNLAENLYQIIKNKK